MNRVLTWVGEFEGFGAYPTINRHLTDAMVRQGWTVLRNQHNQGNTLTPICVVCTYPPSLPNVRHDLNVSYSTWEFPRLPYSFIETYKSVDVVVAMSRTVAAQYAQQLRRGIEYCHLGYDPAEFSPSGNVAPLMDSLRDKYTRLILWVGGTDRRHGLADAVAVLKRLPDTFGLVVKQTSGYPVQQYYHPRLHMIDGDELSLGAYYRGADVFLHSAYAVGFSLPALEAAACGVPVVANPLPTLAEYLGTSQLEGVMENGGRHHLYPEVDLLWYKSDVDRLAEGILNAPPVGQNVVEGLTWDHCASRFSDILTEQWSYREDQ